MNKTYDRTDAKRLVPLLEAISRELGDRLRAIGTLKRRIDKFDTDNASEREQREVMDLHAQLAVHHREVRMAKKELERLGCFFDESVPSRILIPGQDGVLENGFSWDTSDGSIHRVINSVG